MAVIVNGSEIVLSGTVGEMWFEDGFTAAEVIVALAEVGADADVTVRLNSGGGIATEGAAIHSALKAHDGQVTVIVEGIAASAASLLAMAGDEVVMSLGAIMMIHDPSTIAWGTAADLRRSIARLEAVAASAANIYGKKAGKSPADARADMKAELWLTADEAVAAGYADRAESAANDNEPADVTAFDYRRYANAPERLVMLARENEWELRPRRQAPAVAIAPTTPKLKEKGQMPTDKERADAAEKERDELKAKMAERSAGDDAKELATLREEKANRERSDAIMALDEAKGREDVAKALASAGNTVESAKAVLAATPKASDPDGEADPKAYERARMSGAGLGGQGGGQPPKKGDVAVLKSAVDRTNAAAKRA